MASEKQAFEQFEKAKSGIFNGFDFVKIFHQKYRKEDALHVAESDDRADALGVHVGADGVKVYFFCEPEKAKKQVRFNFSVYIF